MARISKEQIRVLSKMYKEVEEEIYPEDEDEEIHPSLVYPELELDLKYIDGVGDFAEYLLKQGYPYEAWNYYYKENDEDNGSLPIDIYITKVVYECDYVEEALKFAKEYLDVYDKEALYYEFPMKFVNKIFK
jgi:hypothetical protein